MNPADDLPPPIPWGQLKKKLPKFMHDSDTARNCLQWLWETAALAARAERDEQLAGCAAVIENLNADCLLHHQRAEAAEKRVAELEEKLMVMCVTQLREPDAIDAARWQHAVAHGFPFECINGSTGNRYWTTPDISSTDFTEAQTPTAAIDTAIKRKQSRPSPDPPAPAPLASQGVEGEPQHER